MEVIKVTKAVDDFSIINIYYKYFSIINIYFDEYLLIIRLTLEQ